MKSPSLWLALLLAGTAPVLADDAAKPTDPDAEYTRVITERVGKIVAPLGIEDAARSARVRDLIVQQYRQLRAIHDPREAKVKAAREQAKVDKAASETAIRLAQDSAKAQLDTLHGEFLAKLGKELSPEQVDKVKDGMTYGIVHVTYKAYLGMLPNLTEAQKAKIMAWLVEARETAMDLGSSDDKHQWFGKYKGRINNYLSAEGYDLKAASKQNVKPAANPPENKAQ